METTCIRFLLWKLRPTQTVKNFPRVLWNQSIRFNSQKSPLLAPVLNQTIPVLIFISRFFCLRFYNLNFKSSEGSLHLSFANYNIVYTCGIVRLSLFNSFVILIIFAENSNCEGPHYIVLCWATAGRQMYNILVTAGHQLYLARLEKTPLDLLNSFIYDSTSRSYNLSFTMRSDPLMSYLGAVLGSFLCLSWMLTANWLADCSIFSCLFSSLSVIKSKSKSHCEWRSVSHYVLVSSPIWVPWPDIYFCLIVTFLFPWGALSDERTGLSLVCAADPCQPLKSSVCVWNRRHLFSRLYLPSQQFGCLRNA
jgi:hypothetical protein